jgi:putative NIF3 family GTP cyclohydrolase 1 type 2
MRTLLVEDDVRMAAALQRRRAGRKHQAGAQQDDPDEVVLGLPGRGLPLEAQAGEERVDRGRLLGGRLVIGALVDVRARGVDQAMRPVCRRQLGDGPDEVSRIDVLCGSGSPALEEAAAKGCEVLVTGDAREPTMAMDRELGVTVHVGGHEATERLGVQALASRLASEFGVEHHFVSDPNPL